MAGLLGLLNVSSDGLAAQSFGLNVTGQNIANANTPLYMRRQALLETQAGLGVQVQGQRQVSDTYADRNFFSATSSQASASEYDGDLSALENVFNDSSGTGLGSSLNQLFTSFQQLSTQPSDPTVRQNVLSSANAFATRVNDISGTIASQRTDLFTKATQLAQQANQQSQEIAKLNQQITEAQMAGRDASGLVDQRNQKLLGLAQVIDIRTTTEANGTVTVQAGGTTLIEGTTTRSLGVGLDSSGNIEVTAQRTGSSDPSIDLTATVTGGQLAAVKQARDTDLLDVSTRLDGFVYDLATAVNQQHAAGFGLDGQSGRNLFDIPATSAAAGQLIRVSSDVAGNPNAIAASDNGSGGSGNSSNAVLLSNIGGNSIISGGRTPAQAYGDIVGDVGSRRAASKSDADLRQSILQQATSARESTSGVSLDEEMVNLQKYQEAYQGNSKMLTTINGLLQDLITNI
jgi:flagellar hook-associated protein 1 FlgK